MWIIIRNIIWILFCVITAQACVTPYNELGRCKSYLECPELFYLTDKHTFLPADLEIINSFRCNPKEENLILCCPVADCYTPDGLPGRCTPVNQCPTVNKTDKEYIRNSRCLHGADEICCGPVARQAVGVQENCASAMTSFPPDPETRCCGIDAFGASRIIGGTDTGLDEYPWLAILKFDQERELCGGALISKKYVLTAAHCVLDTNPPVAVILGEFDRSRERDCPYFKRVCADPVVTIKIEQIIPHHDHNPTDLYFRHDIALLRLATPAPYTDFIRPICLPSELDDVVKKTDRNIKFTVAGWGALDSKHPSSDRKLFVVLPHVDIEECRRLYWNLPEEVVLWAFQLCAGGIRGKDSCTGDSGGPLMYNNNLQYSVVGITSFGPNICGTKNMPSVYTKVAPYNNWIRTHIRP